MKLKEWVYLLILPYSQIYLLNGISNIMINFYMNTPNYLHMFVKICFIWRKGKQVPLQAWSGPEGSRKLRIPDFMTKALEVGKVISLTHRPHLPPQNSPGTLFC